QQAGQTAGSVQQTQQTDIVEYVYLGKRDPFMPLIKQETEKKKGGSPLENFMVSDIKVVGILEKNAVYYAQIVLPDGKSYTIKEGQKLGLMGGVVSKITKDVVVIKEKAIDSEGKPTVKNINIKLRKEEEE
ncbi:MAG: pilus assembly protein PilP, partial [Thermodesulfovibrionales bacterium]|nr:pilus assembly protein PilP [Thermodesulfovibrionales bacterium]